MKKFAMMALALVSATAFANTKTQTAPTAGVTPNAKQAVAHLVVFDTSKKEHKVIEGNALSRSKSRMICSFVNGVNIQDKNLFVQYLKAPQPLQIIAENAKVEAYNNKKEYLVTFDAPKEKFPDGVVSQCWTFSKNDPIGTYHLDIQFNDVVFKDLTFRILK